MYGNSVDPWRERLRLLNAYRWATAFGQAGAPTQAGCTGLNGANGSWTGIASSSTANGFLLASSNGAVVGCGDAVTFGGLATKTLNKPVVGIATTPDGKGYWLAAADGGVFSFGSAPFEGSMGGTPWMLRWSASRPTRLPAVADGRAPISARHRDSDHLTVLVTSVTTWWQERQTDDTRASTTIAAPAAKQCGWRRSKF